MHSKLCLIGTLVCVPFYAQSVEWFESSSPLTQVHQHLLNNDLDRMFHSLVEVWQLNQTKNTKTHLNDLLIQSLSVDCGKGLTSKTFPVWLNSIVIRKVDIQSPGRDAYQVILEAQSDKALNNITLTQWVERPIASDSSFTRSSDGVTEEGVTFRKHYNLNSKLTMGLYRIDITAEDQDSWSTWVIFGEPKAKQTVRWSSKDQWTVDKNALLNRHCPLPRLDVSVYDYFDGEYKEIWQQSYESNYPTQLELTDLTSDRYILAVSMTHKRWQGPIIIEQAQVISKTYNVSLEE